MNLSSTESSHSAVSSERMTLEVYGGSGRERSKTSYRRDDVTVERQ
jgi:hypothetical protein